MYYIVLFQDSERDDGINPSSPSRPSHLANVLRVAEPASSTKRAAGRTESATASVSVRPVTREGRSTSLATEAHRSDLQVRWRPPPRRGCAAPSVLPFLEARARRVTVHVERHAVAAYDGVPEVHRTHAASAAALGHDAGEAVLHGAGEEGHSVQNNAPDGYPIAFPLAE